MAALNGQQSEDTTTIRAPKYHSLKDGVPILHKKTSKFGRNILAVNTKNSTPQGFECIDKSPIARHSALTK